MTTFTIDCDQNITTFDSLKEATAADIAGAEYFGSQEELAQLAASWPSSRLTELWNSLPGVAPVKKFKNRTTALARIWKAAQALTPPVAPQGAHDAPKAARTPKKATQGGKRHTARKGRKERKAPKAAAGKKAATARRGGKEAREGSKKAEVLDLMRRPKGARRTNRASGFTIALGPPGHKGDSGGLPASECPPSVQNTLRRCHETGVIRPGNSAVPRSALGTPT